MRRLKFAWKMLFDRRFRLMLVDVIGYANGVCDRARGTGASDVVLFMVRYGDVMKIVRGRRNNYGSF